MNIKTGLCFGVMVSMLVMSACSDLKQPVEGNQEAVVSAHPDGWLSKPSPNFHGTFIREQIGWDLSNCQQCHGVDYMGGVTSSSCFDCHQNGPEDCNVCHGGVENTTGAPPRDLEGNVNVSARGVGAHTAHLEGRVFANGVACTDCHMVPGVYDAPGHVDTDLPAEVTFGGLALNDGAQPMYTAGGTSCSNVYCHGNWSLSRSESQFANIYSVETMAGNNASPVWTDPSSAACGSCHGLPPEGHVEYALSQCAVCHSTVVDAGGNIADRSKHINGLVNVFGREYPFFQSNN